MPVGDIGPLDVEFWSSDGEYIGTLNECASIDVGAPTEDVNMQNIQLVNRINEMNAALSSLTATFEFTMNNLTNILRFLSGSKLEDNNWRRMHGMKPRRRTLRGRRRKR